MMRSKFFFRRLLPILVPMLFAAACSALPLPWSMPRPDQLDKPVEATASLTVTPSVTPDISCITDWSLIPTPEQEPPIEIPPPVAPFEVPEEVRILALLGTDRNTPFIGRTDAIMLVIYHPRLAQASLVSLPPDMFVYLPGHGMQRLQSAYALGGFGLLAQTLEYNLGTCIDHYLLIHLDDFVAFVDEMGGIYVDVLTGHPKACGGIRPGHVLMNGEKLLCYLSYRIEDGELPRNLRQQEVLRLLFQRIAQGGSLVHLQEWIDTYLARVETNLQPPDLFGAIPLALRVADGSRLGFFRAAPSDLIPYQLPGELQPSVFLPDRDGLRQVLQDALNFVQQAEPPSEYLLTLQYELTTSPTATVTPTPTATGTATVTPTTTLTPVRLPTSTRTPTMTLTPTLTRTSTSPPP